MSGVGDAEDSSSPNKRRMTRLSRSTSGGEPAAASEMCHETQRVKLEQSGSSSITDDSREMIQLSSSSSDPTVDGSARVRLKRAFSAMQQSQSHPHQAVVDSTSSPKAKSSFSSSTPKSNMNASPAKATHATSTTTSVDASHSSSHPHIAKPKIPSSAKHFKLIRHNDYSLCDPSIIERNELSEICSCPAPIPPNPYTCLDDCLNARLTVECSKTCRHKEACRNQRFARRSYPTLQVKEVGAKGCGLFANELIPAGSFIIEYVGEILDDNLCKARIQQYKNSNHFYLLTLSAHATIDATQKGNLSRFINHSCSPNAITQKWIVDGLYCMGIFARQDIHPGTEITFDYKYERFGGKKQACLCGSANCAQFLGGRPKQPDVAHCTCANEGRAMCAIHSSKHANAAASASGSLSRSEDVITQSARELLVTAPPPLSHDAPSVAMPYNSFPRALRKALPLRLIQLCYLMRTASSMLLPPAPRPAVNSVACNAIVALTEEPTPPLRTSTVFQVHDMQM